MADGSKVESKKAPAEPVGFHGVAMRWSVISDVLQRLDKVCETARRTSSPSGMRRVAGAIRGIYNYLDHEHCNSQVVNDVRDPSKQAGKAGTLGGRSNVSNLEGDPRISAYAAAAAQYGLPVWAMMVPGTTRDMFEDITKMQRLVRLIRDYLACSDAQRSNIEGHMAAGLADPDGQANTPRPGDVAFARLMWRLQMASHKLDLATTHWKVPAECCSDDLGAVMTVHEVARELDGLYCRFADLIREHGLYTDSLSPDSFDEGAPEPAYQGGNNG